jgi:hypothetical protein
LEKEKIIDILAHVESIALNLWAYRPREAKHLKIKILSK